MRVSIWFALVSAMLDFGDRSTLARAQEKPALPVVSGAVNRVTVAVADAEAVEPLAGKENAGAFVIKRAGAVDFDLPVFYSVSGTAKNEVDYAKLSGMVTIPTGKESVEVGVKPLADLLVEEDETVILTVLSPACLTIFPPPRTCYAFGDAITAKLVVKNSTAVMDNKAPKVVLTAPSSGEVKLVNGSLAIAAEAMDSDGKIAVVEFFADNRSIGKKSEAVLGRYVIAWVNPPAGDHTLFAQATDDRGGIAKSADVKIRVPQTSPARSTLTVEHPKNGAAFKELADISIDVTAVDPKGYMPRVEFFAGETRIGVSEINFIKAPEPGTPIKHNFVWKRVSAGKHVLHARSTDSQKLFVRSESVSVTVEAGVVANQPVVSVASPDQEAGEILGANERPNTAVFVVSRAGGQDIDLPVFYTLSGSAENGKDYTKLSGTVVIKKGSKAAEVVVTPIKDALTEGVEAVVITVEPPVCLKIFPPPPECYAVGRENQAKAAIYDGKDSPPKVAVTKPANGQVFVSPESITFEAVAADAEGPVARADFYVDGERVGSSTLGPDLLNKPVGGEYRHSFSWKSPVAGTHKLVVKVVDSAGYQAESEAVKFEVTPGAAPTVATRVLPKMTVPGSQFVVQIRVAPVKGTASYAIEETPPKGWRVQSVPDASRFDPASGTLRIGPFFDDVARTFTYTLIPTSETGVFKFEGIIAVETTKLEIGGDQSVEWLFQYHPADINPQNKSIGMIEVTAYGAAWKKGAKWANGPNPIPVGYVTKAAALWKGGGKYVVDGSLGEAPAWWVNTGTTAAASGSVLGSGPAVVLSKLGSDSGSIRAGDSITASSNFGSQSLPPPVARPAARSVQGSSGVVRVEIAVTPLTGSSAYAIAETIPPGWVVESVGEEGVVDNVNQEVKWLFLDSAARLLSYMIRPEGAGASASSRLSGLISFDGQDFEITGDGEIRSTSRNSGNIRLGSVQRTSNGIVSMVVEGTAGVKARVESSVDLKSWSLVFDGNLTADESVVIDEEAAGSAMRFYRVLTE